MSRTRLFFLTLLAMIAFAGNSLLCRLALKHTSIDPANFTNIRIISGALALGLIIRMRDGAHSVAGNWPSALALFIYAAGFSYAYLSLSAATGALILFGTVQATMIGYGLWTGERLGTRQSAGLICAFSGLAALLLPGLSTPSLPGSLLMLSAGVAWGVYSLRGKGAGDPIHVSAGNFLRAASLAEALSVVTLPSGSLDRSGFWYAVFSGALASGVGYAIWYTALRGLTAAIAAVVQLSVPILTAAGGIIFLDEAITLRLMIASTAILGGMALVIIDNKPAKC
ncbi:hypothetical protein A1353_23870 [Methylomonas methanica]|uniref:EamA domain-containing protein n=1 Tax=Methylomonas methanica TaxID=421 RepID=A0A177LUG7_METMH|nr:DMT family transporter [Methylomonas methanica]OAH96913.1 hypothetical protein A1353_23870 [Methylomonas methanica]